MRVLAFSSGFKRLCSIAALAAASLAILVLSGCGHKCGCNNKCNSCKTCAGDSSGAYNNVGTAPQSLSDAQAYNTSSTYSNSSVGESKSLPVFSAPPSVAAPPVNNQPVVTQAVVQQPDNQVRGGGQYHTMQPGETIYAISRKYGVKPKSILEANHFSDPNHLAVGTRVYIPNN